MNEFLPVISIALSAMTLVGLLAVFLAFNKIEGVHDAKQSKEVIPSDPFLCGQPEDLSSYASGGSFDGVLAHLSFSESLNPDRFAEVSQKYALVNLNNLIASRATDGIVFVVNGFQLGPRGVEMAVTASKHGQVLLKDGTAVISRHAESGRALPILKDARTGKIVEQMKGVQAANALSRLTAISAAVVGIAHIISAADVSKRLQTVENKIDLLLEYRRIDHMSRLENIYLAAKELGCGPITQDKRWELLIRA